MTELMRVLQDFGVFVVIILLSYAVYKAAILIDALGEKIKGEKS